MHLDLTKLTSPK